jgi:N-acetylmuramoyl-L-alanine amidase
VNLAQFWLRVVFVVALCVSTRLCSAETWNLATFDNREYVPLNDVADFYGLRLQVGSTPGAVQLFSPGRNLRGTVNSKEFYVQGIKFILSFPLLAFGDSIYLSRNDLTKLIEPVLRPHRLRNLGSVRTIILDPGHGGHDRGAVSPFGTESEFALDVAYRVRDLLLKKRGYRVQMTRTDDTFISLEDRTRIANRYRDNGLFVSIHFNAGSGIGTGIETYLMAPRLVPSYNGDGAPTLAELQQWPGNGHDPENMALATAVHSALLSRLPLDDRGIKRARFHVLRENILPAVLIEGGFVSNVDEARRISFPAYRQAMAEAIVLAIDNFKIATEDTTPMEAPLARSAPAAPTGPFSDEIETMLRQPASPRGPGPKVSVPSSN